MTVTDAIVDWSLSAKYSSLNDSQLRKLKRALADSLACMVGGSQTEVGLAIREYVNSAVVGEETLIPGTELMANQRDAAFINATLANALDYDDTYEEQGKALCHPGATLIGTAISVASLSPCSGKDVITALAVGYEVVGRISESIQPTPSRYEKVWGLNHFLVFGSVIVALRLLGFDEKTARHAFGIAGVAANVPSAWKWNFDNRNLPLSWQKDMVSWPAEAGIRAALLADSGFRGCLDILDGDQGFWRMSASDQFDPSRILNNLGDFTRIENLAFKPYPCCRWLHSSIEAFKQTIDESGLGPKDILAIEVQTLTELANHFAVQKPLSMIDAEFSLPYVISMVAQGIPPGPVWHKPGIRTSDRTQAIASKVKILPSKKFDELYYQQNRIGAYVTVRDKEDNIWRAECQQAKGGYEKPLSDEEHMEKIVGLVDPVLGIGKGKDLLSSVDRIEEVSDFYKTLESCFH